MGRSKHAWHVEVQGNTRGELSARYGGLRVKGPATHCNALYCAEAQHIQLLRCCDGFLTPCALPLAQVMDAQLASTLQAARSQIEALRAAAAP